MNSRHLNCDAVIKRVIDHLERTPGVPLDAETEKHLKACADCHSRAEIERRIRIGTGKLNCEEVIELLFDYLDQEISHPLSTHIERHLETCRDCFSRAEFEKRLRARVRESAEVQAPERLKLRIKSLIEKF
ncbi:MAG: zf-HC2 domain-containing protein [Saccharospirillum sp.]|nr:zf-HC2 domain-containing protein [Saccharospirillum sp.]